MKKIEYRTVRPIALVTEARKTEADVLNYLGAEGWMLVDVFRSHGSAALRLQTWTIMREKTS